MDTCVNESKRPVKIHAGTMVAAYQVIGDEQLEMVGENQVRLITEAMGPENDRVQGKGSRKEKLQTLIKQKDWTHLNEEQKVSVIELIKQYSNLFIVEKGELGLIQQAPAHILVKDPTPCRSPIYRYPEKAKGTCI